MPDPTLPNLGDCQPIRSQSAAMSTRMARIATRGPSVQHHPEHDTGWCPLFKAFEEGRLREEVCTRRIEEISAELTSLEARRSELAEEISESQPSVPDPAELAELVGTSSALCGTERCGSARL